MRVSTPWFIAGAVGLFVLIFMMFTYAKNMENSKYGGITRNSLGSTSEQEQALAHRVFHGSNVCLKKVASQLCQCSSFNLSKFHKTETLSLIIKQQ